MGFLAEIQGFKYQGAGFRAKIQVIGFRLQVAMP